MIHRLTLPHRILADYEERNVFARYHQRVPGHIMLDDISIKAGADDLREILADAETHSKVTRAHSPNLVRAYVKLAEKIRSILRKESHQPEIGRDQKSAAAGERNYDYD